MLLKVFISCFIIVFTTDAFAIMQWVNPDGSRGFGDNPPAGAKTVIDRDDLVENNGPRNNKLPSNSSATHNSSSEQELKYLKQTGIKCEEEFAMLDTICRVTGGGYNCMKAREKRAECDANMNEIVALQNKLKYK